MEAGRRSGRQHPRQSAGLLSTLFFTWALQIFKKDYKKRLEVEDLWEPVDNHRSEKLGDRLEQKWEAEFSKKRKAGKTPSLMVALFKCFKWELTVIGVLSLAIQTLEIFFKPYLLGEMLSYFKSSSRMDKSVAIGSALGLLGSTLVTNLLANHYNLTSFSTGMKVRAACVSLVYRKCLYLSRRAMGEASPGQIVNLVANDVSRFEQVVFLVHYLWAGPLSTLIVAYFLYQEVGLSGLAGIAVIFTVVPLQSYTGKLTSKYRLQIAYKTDERIRLTDEVLGGINVIKMYAWEKPFIAFLEQARKLELRVIKKANYIRAIYMTFNLFTTRMALFCTIMAYVLSGNPLSERIFVVIVYFGIISSSMTSLFVRGFAEIAECLVSMKRLQKFMLNEEVERQPFGRAAESSDDLKSDHAKVHIQVEEGVASWDPSSSDPTLRNINLKVENGTLVGIIGSVGSGKSSLLNLFLREIPLISGKVKVNGTVSYAAQDQWVFAGTVRQNILFGLPYDGKRYKEVIKVCSLERDMELFPNGDQTVVGERGASLSGGQKARINLARTVYKKADIYLLDDPLSAVDAHVGKRLFHDCLRGFLRGKTIVLATHQLQFVKKVDHIISLENGTIEMQGSSSDLEKSGYVFSRSTSNSESSETGLAGVNLDKRLSLVRMISIKSTESKSSLDDETIYGQEEDKVGKEVETHTFYKGSAFLGYIRSGTNVYAAIFITVLFILSQMLASSTDLWVSQWIKQEEIYNRQNTTTSAEETDLNISLHGGLVGCLLVAALLRGIIFYASCAQCSRGLHSSMIKSVIHTHLNFFSKNPSGGILNRFSKDLGTTDELLPKSMLDCGQLFGQVIGAFITASLVNVWFLLPVTVFAMIAFSVRAFYVKTSKNLKRLENMCRSPVFSHLNTTLHGLPSIRAHGAQNYLRTEFDLHQDLHTAVMFSFLGAQQCYAYLLDVVGSVYFSCIVLSFIIFNTDSYGADVGLAITQTMSITFLLQWGMRQSSEIVNMLTSVERLLAFKNLPPEEPDLARKLSPPADWPKKGEVEFKDLSLWYEKDEPPVISNLCLQIHAGEKIGIVGRTGAGKSSLIAALFRLTETSGEVTIDGVATSTIPHQALRSRISIIPQDPVLFFGTIRRNLDPFSELPDFALWKALEEVELRESLRESGGLEARVAEGGGNLSVGQRQLICLARAILRGSRLIVLDEATANVDPKTDSLIQSTIKRRFKDATVLTIAHRLHTVMDSDRIIVMDAGRMVEFDAPHILLQRKDGYLYSLVQETGRAMASQLSEIAVQSYWRKHQESLEE